jgi:hypothetical protein
MLAFRTELELIADYKPWNSFSNQEESNRKLEDFLKLSKTERFIILRLMEKS